MILQHNKLVFILLLIIVAMLAYHFLYLSKEKAALIVYKHISGVDWDAGYLRARAKAIKGNKETFKYKKDQYSTSTGKKFI